MSHENNFSVQATPGQRERTKLVSFIFWIDVFENLFVQSLKLAEEWNMRFGGESLYLLESILHEAMLLNFSQPNFNSKCYR